jgi:hypothetical protein
MFATEENKKRIKYFYLENCHVEEEGKHKKI